MMNQKQKKNTVIILALIVVGGFALMYYNANPSDDKVDKKLADAAQELNALCPLSLPDDSRMDSVTTAKGKTMVYHVSIPYYELYADGDTIDTVALKDAVLPEMVNHLRTSTPSKPFYNHRCNIKRIYYDKNGTYITTVLVTPKDYLIFGVNKL